jgi:putative addiction module CopG family antidote
MNMRIVLDKKTQKFIAEKVSAGEFKSPSDVVKKGVALLRAREAPKMNRLEKAIQKGLDDYHAGNYVTLAPHEIKDYMRKRREEVFNLKPRRKGVRSKRT